MHGRFCIVLPKMHGLFRMVLPKMLERFRMDPLPKWTLNDTYGSDGPTSGVPLNLLLLDIHSWGFLLTNAIMQEKQQQNLLQIERTTHIGFPCL